MTTLDARGKACPMPVILARKALLAGQIPLTVLVDNDIAVENLRRLAAHENCTCTVTPAAGEFTVLLTRAGTCPPPPAPTPAAARGDFVLYVGRDTLGEGDRTLGTNLMRMLFYTLQESSPLPAAILFLNSGVKLPTGDPQIIDHLRELQRRGVEVLVCGTCLGYYGLTDQLQVGTISNLFELWEKMQTAGRVITL